MVVGIKLTATLVIVRVRVRVVYLVQCHIDHSRASVRGGFAGKSWDTDGDDELSNAEHQHYSTDPHIISLKYIQQDQIKVDYK